MPEISTEALIVCIQAVASELRALQEGAENGELEPEEYLLLEERRRVAENLEEAYDQLAETILNLPPYDQLTGG
ncbi:hypothetical protein V8J88_16925 [Massilia sp. W12]|uniref:hypothetical protein n=1 Tax=Massilia sp. W12 TaxID=3126507 RepID=UPI0030D48F99